MQNNEVKISVVIPIYNVEKYIYKTIESLKVQSFHGFEVLLINDGSSDNSILIAEECLNTSNLNYKIFNKNNEGVSKTRNLGIEKAEGRYIYFLDGDDYIEDTLLEKFYNRAEEERADVVFCGYTHINSVDNSIFMKVHKYIDKPISGLDAAEAMLQNKFWVSAISGFYRREMLIKNNIQFPINIVFGEDTVFAIKALMNSERVSCVKEPLVYYVRRQDSVTKSANEKYFNLHESNLEILKYNRDNFNSEKVERALRQYKMPQSIMRIFSALAKSGVCKEQLMKFISSKDIRDILKEFKVNGDRENIKFKVASLGLLLSPQIMYGILNNRSERK